VIRRRKQRRRAKKEKGEKREGTRTKVRE